MNGLASAFLAAIGGLMLLGSRRVALAALVIGTCYIPFYAGVQLGPVNLTAIRVLVAIGFVRTLTRSEYPIGPLNRVDYSMLAWSAWLIFTSSFHEDPPAALIFRLGLVYDALGIYVLARSYCRSMDDISAICQSIAVALVPLAIAMLYQKISNYNVFSLLGGAAEHSIVREGKIRASGPFGHPILAGTVGGVCLPLMIGLWKQHRGRSVIGITACIAVIVSSASSGPILAAVAGLLGLYLWRFRAAMRRIRWLAVCAYIALDLVMKDPAYFLIARVDLAGGSTSWYRARLIQSALEHLSEWWLVGTDNTRAWMWVVVSWSAKHTDITSHYIQLGVWGGVLLIVLFLLTLKHAFDAVGRAVDEQSGLPSHIQFPLWSFGAQLFAIAVTGLSVSYFDQSIVFVYLAVGTLGSVASLVAHPAIAKQSASSRPVPVAVPDPCWGGVTVDATAMATRSWPERST